MNLQDKINFNKQSALNNGWDPSWFKLSSNDYSRDLIEKIVDFQNEYDLEPDGLVGDMTFRRIYTHVSLAQMEEPKTVSPTENNTIVYAGIEYPILWSKVKKWNEEGGLTCKGRKTSGRNIRYFVNHWDVCLSSKSCASVLNKRGLGVHFLIDNDGTIFQCADIEDVCSHAGGHNGRSIGCEISNAYSLKYQSWYKERFGERPIWKDVYVHGKKLKPFLGFYHHQIQALAALWASVSIATGIPIKTPLQNDTVDYGAASGDFDGFLSHLHLTKRKIDPAGLDLFMVQEMAIMIKIQQGK